MGELFTLGVPKEEFKQTIARMMLEQLSLRGYNVSQEVAGQDAILTLMNHAGLPTHSYVVLLKQLCDQFRLDPVAYEVFADPAGQQGFAVKARIGYVERIAIGPTKQIAQHLAAEQIYRHLRSRLYGTDNFNEELAVICAFEKAFAATSDEDTPDEQHPAQEEQGEAAAAVPRSTRRNRKKKDRRNAAVRAAVAMELQQEQATNEVGPEAPPPPEELPVVDDSIAMGFISRTMERLGI